MAVLPIQPIPFFANKNQAFWRLQLAGWGGAMLLRAMSAIANGQPPAFLLLVLIARSAERRVRTGRAGGPQDRWKHRGRAKPCCWGTSSAALGLVVPVCFIVVCSNDVCVSVCM